MKAFLNFLFSFTFLTYLIGGYSRDGSLLGYHNDLLRVTIVFGLIGFFKGTDLTQCFIFRSFLNLQDFFLKKTRLSYEGWFAVISCSFLVLSFIALPILRHESFGSWFWDLGAMEQVIWRKAFGYGLTSTGITGQYDPPIDFLWQQHLNFWLIPTAWLYRVFPHTEFLLILQSVALLGAFIPLWKISKEICPRWLPVILISLYYWDWHSVHQNNIWDIHEACYLTMVSLWAYYFFIKKRYFLTALFTLIVALFKEDAWVLAGAMSLYFFSSQRKWGWGILCFVIGFGIFVSYGVLFNKVNTLPQRYAYLGNNFSETLPILKANPFVFFQHLFTPGPLLFIASAVGISGGLWLLGGLAVVPVLPTLFENALSSSPANYSFDSHYILGIGGPVMFATLKGIERLSKMPMSMKKKYGILALATAVSLAQLDFSEPYQIKSILSGTGWKNRECLEQLISKIPKDAPVYTNVPLASHLSRRPIYFYYDLHGPPIKNSWMAISEETPLPPEFIVKEKACGQIIAYNGA